jgi:ketosteroid isomerase-like protein
MSDPRTKGDLEAFLNRAEEAAVAYVRGDMERYVELVPHAEPFTLLPPYGGPAGRHENRSETVRASAGFIQDGDARLEDVEIHSWSDTLVVAMIERQHGRVEGRPDQDLSLRVTHVYRRDGEDWHLVHRHADPLVEEMSLDELQALMRR